MYCKCHHVFVFLHPYHMSNFSFQIKNFTSPIVIPPHETDSSLSLLFTPSDTLSSLSTMLRLGTNASLFTIPVHAYTGKLKVSTHFFKVIHVYAGCSQNHRPQDEKTKTAPPPHPHISPKLSDSDFVI